MAVSAEAGLYDFNYESDFHPALRAPFIQGVFPEQKIHVVKGIYLFEELNEWFRDKISTRKLEKTYGPLFKRTFCKDFKVAFPGRSSKKPARPLLLRLLLAKRKEGVIMPGEGESKVVFPLGDVAPVFVIFTPDYRMEVFSVGGIVTEDLHRILAARMDAVIASGFCAGARDSRKSYRWFLSSRRWTLHPQAPGVTQAQYYLWLLLCARTVLQAPSALAAEKALVCLPTSIGSTAELLALLLPKQEGEIKRTRDQHDREEAFATALAELMEEKGKEKQPLPFFTPDEAKALEDYLRGYAFALPLADRVENWRLPYREEESGEAKGFVPLTRSPVTDISQKVKSVRPLPLAYPPGPLGRDPSEEIVLWDSKAESPSNFGFVPFTGFERFKDAITTGDGAFHRNCYTRTIMYDGEGRKRITFSDALMDTYVAHMVRKARFAIAARHKERHDDVRGFALCVEEDRLPLVPNALELAVVCSVHGRGGFLIEQARKLALESGFTEITLIAAKKELFSFYKGRYGYRRLYSPAAALNFERGEANGMTPSLCAEYVNETNYMSRFTREETEEEKEMLDAYEAKVEKEMKKVGPTT